MDPKELPSFENLFQRHLQEERQAQELLEQERRQREDAERTLAQEKQREREVKLPMQASLASQLREDAKVAAELHLKECTKFNIPISKSRSRVSQPQLPKEEPIILAGMPLSINAVFSHYRDEYLGYKAESKTRVSYWNVSGFILGKNGILYSVEGEQTGTKEVAIYNAEHSPLSIATDEQLFPIDTIDGELTERNLEALNTFRKLLIKPQL